MKYSVKILVLTALMSMFAVFAASAKDVVYLNNGNVIKGKVIEQTADEVKIEMSGGSVVSFEMSAVKSVAKDKKAFYNTEIKKGYRGFLDIGYTMVFDHESRYGNEDVDDGLNRMEITTSHGYQFNNYLFVGAGVCYIRCMSVNGHAWPVFAHVRTDLMKKSITPFIDVKAGYSIGGMDGLYLSPSVGCRFAISKDYGLNVSVGYSFIEDNYKQLVIDKYTNRYYEDRSRSYDGLILRLGLDF